MTKIVTAFNIKNYNLLLYYYINVQSFLFFFNLFSRFYYIMKCMKYKNIDNLKIFMLKVFYKS